MDINTGLKKLSIGQIRAIAKDTNKIVSIERPSTKSKGDLVKELLQIHNNLGKFKGKVLLGYDDKAHIQLPKMKIKIDRKKQKRLPKEKEVKTDYKPPKTKKETKPRLSKPKITISDYDEEEINIKNTPAVRKVIQDNKDRQKRVKDALNKIRNKYEFQQESLKLLRMKLKAERDKKLEK